MTEVMSIVLLTLALLCNSDFKFINTVLYIVKHLLNVHTGNNTIYNELYSQLGKYIFFISSENQRMGNE